MKIENVVNNLINGNLKDAKHGAKRHGFWSLRDALKEAGHSEAKAEAGAAYLKEAEGNATWQDYCDAI